MARLNLGFPIWLLAPFSRQRRRQVANRLLSLMSPIPSGATLLDVGGPGMATMLVAHHFQSVVVANVTEEALSPTHIAVSHPIDKVLGDGCVLPFRENSVDFVFSDNVIEHVSEDKRERFINELRRVARRGFFITTPNYWFPFEPHYHMPFFQFLPRVARERLVRIARFGFIDSPGENIKLLSRRDLRRLAPDATVTGIGFTPFAETLVAAWRR
jgi:ubiquinone/menaquinone biosynthesis C-methylase UbiE